MGAACKIGSVEHLSKSLSKFDEMCVSSAQKKSEGTCSKTIVKIMAGGCK